MTVKITINGDDAEFEAPISISALLAALELDARKIAVEHNLSIVPRSQFDRVVIQDGDKLEIVNFVGGG